MGRRDRSLGGVGEDGRPRPELGLPAAPLPVDAGTTPTTAALGGEASTTVPGRGPATTTQPSAASGTTTTTVPDTYRTVAHAADLRGDHGLEGPPYADLVALSVERGTRTMRFTVEVAGDLPAALAAGEVEGIGIDLYRGAVGIDVESAYQVFVDGGSDGWRAYLQVGNDFVPYRGSFRLGGARLELVVPLDAFTDGDPERASAFADWSYRGSGAARSSEDHLPAAGTVPIGG